MFDIVSGSTFTSSAIVFFPQGLLVTYIVFPWTDMELYFLFFNNWLVLSTIPEYGDLGQGWLPFIPECALLPYMSFKMPSSLFAIVVWTFAYLSRSLLHSMEHHLCFYFQAPHLPFLFAILWVSPSPGSIPCVTSVYICYITDGNQPLLIGPKLWEIPLFSPYINDPNNDLWETTISLPKQLLEFFQITC